MAAGRNYERKGDPFTLKVVRGEGPRTVRQWQRVSTGRVYFTRVLASSLPVLRVRDIAPQVRECAGRLGVEPAALPDSLAVDWQPWAQVVTLQPVTVPPSAPDGQRLGLQVTRTGAKGEGVRYWLTCPLCGGRAGAVYAARHGAAGEYLDLEGSPLTGCRSCLGLTDESRQRHKCLDWAGAVHGWRGYKPSRWGRYQVRAAATRERALRCTLAACRGLLPGR